MPEEEKMPATLRMAQGFARSIGLDPVKILQGEALIAKFLREWNSVYPYLAFIVAEHRQRHPDGHDCDTCRIASTLVVK